MRYDITTKYPDELDNLIFFHDIDLDHKPIMDEYQRLIAAGDYDSANEFIAAQDGVHGYFADLYNLIENRILSTQEYILTKIKINPHIYGETEPENAKVGDIWVNI